MMGEYGSQCLFFFVAGDGDMISVGVMVTERERETECGRPLRDIMGDRLTLFPLELGEGVMMRVFSVISIRYRLRRRGEV